MERLTLSDVRSRRPTSHRFTSYEDRCFAPQLPTPEASRSSHDAQSPARVTHREMNSQSPSLPKGASTCNPSPATVDQRRNSPSRPTPLSPPYGNIDTQRPSLPPLKTVLGDTSTSPPSTPSPRDKSIQPIPREPSYTTSTYKPPALYPNKKLKVEQSHSLPFSQWPSLSATPSTHSVSSHTSRSLGVSTEQSRPITHTGPLTHDTGHYARRASLPPYARDRDELSQTPEVYRRASPGASSLANRPASGHENYHPSMEIMQPRVHNFEGRADERFYPVSSGEYPRSYDQQSLRRPSASEYPAQAFEPSSVDYDSASQPSRTAHAGYPPNEFASLHNPVYISRHMDGPGAPMGSYNPSHLQGGTMPFFMPNPYDSPHAKARKRSNLPKHSTEIMKTWFDQNISNPYPSEEQKAMFSNATGISMTQVSNWFINHRRRCPELRDKREKGRPDGREGEF